MGRVAAFGTFLGGGYAGSRVSKTLRQQRRGVVPAAIADLVRDGGLAALKAEDVAKLQARYDVDPAEFEAQLSEVYARYLRQLINADDNTPAQIKQLGQLRRGIGLRWNATEALNNGSTQAGSPGLPGLGPLLEVRRGSGHLWHACTMLCPW